jgi:uncharacterized damage-inducible protein DinB
MINNIATFADYFAGIRRRTLNYVRAIPADRLDWAPRDGEYTCGDIVRHLVAAEPMFVGAIVTGRWRYAVYAPAEDDTLEGLIARMEADHAEAMRALRSLDDAVLAEPRPTLDGPPVKAWRLLMALAEHEIHHRSQLAVYLALMGVEPPQIFGLGVEDVIARATG